MRGPALALAVALASFACTCGELEPAPPAADTDALADPIDDPQRPRQPRAGPRPGRGQKGGKIRPGPADPADPAEPSPEPAPVPGITYKGDDTWQVERSLVDRYESDPDRLGARVEEHGKGWQLHGVGEQDDAWALGARNGDVIKRINGMPLDTTTDLLLVWAELGDASKLDVQLTRDGETRVHHYEIVR